MSAGKGGFDKKRIEIVEVKNLTAKNRVAIIKVDEAEYFVGISENGIKKIDKIKD